jgi:hypothetical protein
MSFAFGAALALAMSPAVRKIENFMVSDVLRPKLLKRHRREVVSYILHRTQAGRLSRPGPWFGHRERGTAREDVDELAVQRLHPEGSWTRVEVD